MERSRLADYSEILSSIAIVVTLVYLAIEISQNTRALRAQTAQAVLQASQSELMVLVERPDIALSIPASGALTPELSVILDAYFAINMRAREFAWIQHKNGAIDDANWESELTVLRIQLDSQRIRDWWTRIGHNYSSKEFGQVVEKIIQNEPATDVLWSLPTSWATE